MYLPNTKYNVRSPEYGSLLRSSHDDSIHGINWRKLRGMKAERRLVARVVTEISQLI
jgi:hypothetical protein